MPVVSPVLVGLVAGLVAELVAAFVGAGEVEVHPLLGTDDDPAVATLVVPLVVGSVARDDAVEQAARQIDPRAVTVLSMP